MNLVQEFERKNKLDYKENTMINYKINMREFLEFAKEHLKLEETNDIEVIQKADWSCCIEFRNHLHSLGLAETSINRKLSAMRTLFKFSMNMNLIKENPSEKVGNLSTQHIIQQTDFLTEEELSKLFKTIRTHYVGAKNFDFISKRDMFLYLLLATSGLRIEEAMELKEDNFDFDNNEVVVLGKGGKIRFVPIDDLVKEWYNKYMVERNILEVRNMIKKGSEGYIFLSPQGMRLTTRASNFNLAKYCRRANIKVISNHALRHTFATIQMERGTHPMVICEMLGHSDVKTTKRYTHTRREVMHKNIGVQL